MVSLSRLSVLPAVCLFLPAILMAQPGPGTVPEPKHIAVTALPDIKNWATVVLGDEPLPPLEFTADLDLLAPLGAREGNAAVYFAHFTKPHGDRAGEVEKAATTRIEGVGAVYRFDDPLLTEAEPWADAATMRFYPDVLSLSGPFTDLPNVMHFMTLGRTWAARAAAATDREKTKADYRRVVRLGRLLRQDSVTPFQDLAAVALIKMGANGLYQTARAEGDAATMTVAALVAGDASMFRAAVGAIAALSVGPGRKMDAAQFDQIVRAARESGFRPMREKALMSLYFVANKGTKAEREKGAAMIAALTSDADSLVAADAKYYQNLKWTPQVEKMFKSE